MANQTQNLAAMLENFEGVQKAYGLAMESAGSATQENTRYMESLVAKTANLKAAFEDLVLGDGGIHDFIASALDTGTAILEGLQNPVVQTTIEIVALATVIRNLNQLLKLKAFAGIAQILPQITASISDIVFAFSTLGAKSGLKLIGVELQSLLGSTLSVAGAASGIVAAFAIMYKNLKKEVKDYKEELEGITPGYQGLETIQKQAEETAKTLELSKQEFEETSSKVEEYQNTLEVLGSKTNRTKTEEEQLQAALKGINAIFPSLNASIDSNTGMLNLEGGVVSELTVAYEKLATAKALAMEISAKESEWTALTNSLNALDDQIEQINKDYSKVDSFWNWYGAGGPVKGGASYGFGRDYVYTMTYRDKNKELKELEKQRSAITSQLDDLRRSQNSLQYDISENVSDFLQNAFTSKGSGSAAFGDGEDGLEKSCKKAEDALKKLKSSFDEIISVIEHKISLDQQAGASTEEQIQAYKDLQTETHRQAQVYRSMGLSETHEYIRSLQKLWWQYYDTIQDLQKKAYEEEISYQKNLVSALSFYADEQKTSLDKQIEALNEELQALEDQNDEREKALELTKAQQNLEDARKQKIRVYQKGQGWTWVSDPRKVAEAEEELESIQRERALEDEKQAIQDRIDAYEKQKQAWSDVVSDYGKYQNRLELEMQLGTTIEKAIFGDRTKNIENFKDAYIKAINSMITAQQKLNEMNDVKTTLPSESMIGGTGGSIAGATTTGGGGGGVNKYSSSDDRSVMEAKMKANSKAWHTADSATRKKLESENQKIGKALGMKYTSSTGKWAYASGTTGMPSTQLALVGERGAELGIFPRGTGIVPHNLTENLMEIGKYSMNQLKTILGRPSGTIDKSSHISINEVRVNSNNADNFVRQLQNMVFNQK